MDYILPKFRFYEELKEAKEDYRLKDKIIICDWGVDYSLKGLFLDEFNVRIMYEDDIKKEIELYGKKICWITMGTAYTGARNFYKRNERTLKKVEYIIFVSEWHVPYNYYGLELCKVVKEDSCIKLLTRFVRPSYTHNGYIEPEKSLLEKIWDWWKKLLWKI